MTTWVNLKLLPGTTAEQEDLYIIKAGMKTTLYLSTHGWDVRNHFCMIVCGEKSKECTRVEEKEKERKKNGREKTKKRRRKRNIIIIMDIEAVEIKKCTIVPVVIGSLKLTKRIPP